LGKIIELLQKRCSMRSFLPTPIPASVLEEILEAGRLSPSGGNEQSWRFGVITNPDLIARVAQIAYNQSWIASAPLVIVLCTMPVSEEAGGRDIQKSRFPEHARDIASMDQDLYWALNEEEHQTKIAGTHMVLAALEHGVGSCWVSYFEVRRLASFLNLPKNSLPSEILVFGYPEKGQKMLPKKHLDEIVWYL
jgi:nitroreductase